jgi:hypothetical protein
VRHKREIRQIRQEELDAFRVSGGIWYSSPSPFAAAQKALRNGAVTVRERLYRGRDPFVTSPPGGLRLSGNSLTRAGRKCSLRFADNEGTGVARDLTRRAADLWH